MLMSKLLKQLSLESGDLGLEGKIMAGLDPVVAWSTQKIMMSPPRLHIKSTDFFLKKSHVDR